MICSRNRVPKPGSKIPYSVPNLGNYYPVFYRNRTKYHKFLPVFLAIQNVKHYCSFDFAVCIHKLCRSITRRALVSETTNIISCDATTFQAVVFVTYLGQMEFETWSGYSSNCKRVPGPKPGNAEQTA